MTEKSENMLPLKDMNLGYATEALLRELQNKGTVTAKQLRKFREETRIVVMATLKKLIERSPLSFSFVRLVALFNPATMSQESSKKSNLKGFKLLLKLFLDYNILSASQCDKATQEFKIFMDEVFASFDEETTD